MKLGYYICGVTAIISFFVRKDFAFGIIFGSIVGATNFILLEKHINFFIKNKKLPLIFVSYILRYFLIALILYVSIKQSIFMFMGAVLGFLINQAVFFGVKLRKT